MTTRPRDTGPVVQTVPPCCDACRPLEYMLELALERLAQLETKMTTMEDQLEDMDERVKDVEGPSGDSSSGGPCSV